MKILFVSSGNANTQYGISSIVYNQGKSLEKQGVEVDYYGIVGKGVRGYLNNIFRIRRKIKQNCSKII